MNHEVFDNSEKINTEKTEWDSLGEEVDFNSHEKEENDELFDFVEKKYGDSINAIIDHACFDGGDKNDADCYVVSMLLQDYLTDDEQLRAIECRANGQPIPEEFSAKIKGMLAKKIESSSLAEEIKRDPFLITRHVDNIAGRSDESLSREDGELAKVLWCATPDFYKTGGAISLLYDKDFISKAYDVHQLTESEFARKTYDFGIEEGEEKVINNISKHVTWLVQNGEATVEEIINDPFLRKRRFDSLLQIETTGLEVSSALADLWSYDENFKKSTEYSMMLFDKVREHPDIYEKVNKEEVDKLVAAAIEEIPLGKYHEIMRVYEKDPRKGDKVLIEALLPVLGLENNPPSIDYGKSENGEGGFYARHNHKIVVCEEKLDEEIPDEERILSATKNGFFSRLFRPRKMEEKLFKRMGVVAHEMWHAHQWAGENVDTERREKYQQNFVYYMSGTGSYHSYRAQLIEQEAWAFGQAFEDMSRTAYANKEKNNGKSRKISNE